MRTNILGIFTAYVLLNVPFFAAAAPIGSSDDTAQANIETSGDANPTVGKAGITTFTTTKISRTRRPSARRRRRGVRVGANRYGWAPGRVDDCAAHQALRIIDDSIVLNPPADGRLGNAAATRAAAANAIHPRQGSPSTARDSASRPRRNKPVRSIQTATRPRKSPAKRSSAHSLATLRFPRTIALLLGRRSSCCAEPSACGPPEFAGTATILEKSPRKV